MDDPGVPLPVGDEWDVERIRDDRKVGVDLVEPVVDFVFESGDPAVELVESGVHPSLEVIESGVHPSLEVIDPAVELCGFSSDRMVDKVGSVVESGARESSKAIDVVVRLVDLPRRRLKVLIQLLHGLLRPRVSLECAFRVLLGVFHPGLDIVELVQDLLAIPVHDSDILRHVVESLVYADLERIGVPWKVHAVYEPHRGGVHPDMGACWGVAVRRRVATRLEQCCTHSWWMVQRSATWEECLCLVRCEPW